MHHSLIPLVQHRRSLGRWAILLVLLSLLFVPGTLKAQSNLTLSIASTSEPDSSDTEDGSAGNERPVMIGEVVTYQLTLDVPEGTSTNVSVVDALPDGLQYMSGSVSASTVNVGSWSLSAPTVSGGAADGDDVTFNFGTITNSDNDADVEQIVITFDALVSNIAANQDGTDLVNTATLSANGSTVGTSEERTVTVVEPDLTIEVRPLPTFNPANGPRITEGDAGDTIYYRTFITNNGDSPAYDVRVAIPFPSDYVTTVFCCTTTGPTPGAAVIQNTPNLIFGWDYIEADTSVSVSVQVTVRDEVAPGENWDVTATVTYQSLPDENGTDDNVPGSYGAASGARDSSDGEGGALNDYELSDTSDTFTVPDVDVTKQIEHPSQTPVATTFFGGTYSDSTDDPNTGVSEHDASTVDLAIGEEFSYIVTVTFPEGTTYDIVMIDLASPNNQTGGRQLRVIELLSAEVIWVAPISVVRVLAYRLLGRPLTSLTVMAVMAMLTGLSYSLAVIAMSSIILTV